MENVLNLIVVMLAGLVLIALIFWVGFQVRPRVVRPEFQVGQPVRMIPVPAGLPEPLDRFIRTHFGDMIPLTDGVAAWGRGKITGPRIPRFGPVWLPLRWSLFLRPGQQFVWRASVYWLTFSLFQGGDEFRFREAAEEDAPPRLRGRFKMANTMLDNQAMDLSETTVLWLFTLMVAPAMLLADERVTWRSISADTVAFDAPYGDATLEFQLVFDSQTADLVQVNTQRAASRDGAHLPYQAILGEYWPAVQWGKLPGSVAAAWEEDYYIRYEIKGVTYGVDVENELEAGIEGIRR